MGTYECSWYWVIHLTYLDCQFLSDCMFSPASCHLKAFCWRINLAPFTFKEDALWPLLGVGLCMLIQMWKIMGKIGHPGPGPQSTGSTHYCMVLLTHYLFSGCKGSCFGCNMTSCTYWTSQLLTLQESHPLLHLHFSHKSSIVWIWPAYFRIGPPQHYQVLELITYIIFKAFLKHNGFKK